MCVCAPRKETLVPRLRPLALQLFIPISLLTPFIGRAQTAGPSVNMVSGTGWTNGDPFLQRQNEASLPASTRNTLHLFSGTNDYRSVDVAGFQIDRER